MHACMHTYFLTCMQAYIKCVRQGMHACSSRHILTCKHTYAPCRPTSIHPCIHARIRTHPPHTDTHPSVHPSIHPSIQPSIHPSDACLSVITICLRHVFPPRLSLSLCLSLSLSLWLEDARVYQLLYAQRAPNAARGAFEKLCTG